MTDWPALIADLEAWDGTPSRALADRVLVAWGWTLTKWPSSRRSSIADPWKSPEGHLFDPSDRPDPLTSMDAAMAGVPDGCEISMRLNDHACVASVFRGSTKVGWWGMENRQLPHALTIAICKARQEMEQGLPGND